MSATLKTMLIVVTCLYPGMGWGQPDPCRGSLTVAPTETSWRALIECIQHMDKENADLQSEISVMREQLNALTVNTANRFDGLGKSEDIVPNFGNGQTDLCAPGYLMVGARTTTADGDHAGMQYGFQPICRLISGE